MQIKKSDPNSLIKLQNGEYCHVTDQLLIINETLNFDKKDVVVDLSKTKNRKKMRLVLNVIFTLAVFCFAIFWLAVCPLQSILFELKKKNGQFTIQTHLA